MRELKSAAIAIPTNGIQGVTRAAPALIKSDLLGWDMKLDILALGAWVHRCTSLDTTLDTTFQQAISEKATTEAAISNLLSVFNFTKLNPYWGRA
jgi:hypothetical protein